MRRLGFTNQLKYFSIFSSRSYPIQIAFDAMCDMLMSITDESLLKNIEQDCTTISNAMLSIPIMIPGTRYYKGMKVEHVVSYFY